MDGRVKGRMCLGDYMDVREGPEFDGGVWRGWAAVEWVARGGEEATGDGFSGEWMDMVLIVKIFGNDRGS